MMLIMYGLIYRNFNVLKYDIIIIHYVAYKQNRSTKSVVTDKTPVPYMNRLNVGVRYGSL